MSSTAVSRYEVVVIVGTAPIENEQDHITLLCDITFRNEKWIEYYTYFIKDLFMPNCLRILEYNYQKLEDFSQNEMHASKYCVTPPNYTPSESD